MKVSFTFVCMASLATFALAQSPTPPSAGSSNNGGSPAANSVSADSGLKDMFESKIKVEWEALKNKDRKSYAELLADDYQGVEVDGRGERTKIKALNELQH